MRITKTGIHLPEGKDNAGEYWEAIHTLWLVCCEISDVLDKMHDDIKQLKRAQPTGDMEPLIRMNED